MDKNKAKTPNAMFISIVFTPVGHNEKWGGGGVNYRIIYRRNFSEVNS